MIRVSKLVKNAIEDGHPVVALETGIVTHALPRPMNLEAALRVSKQLISQGVVPATIAVIKGQIVVGLELEELDQIASNKNAAQVSIRDIPVAKAQQLNGGVNLAAVIHIAKRVGIQVCASTGLGGIHRLGRPGMQESSDLTALSNHPVVLVTSGVRPALDEAATLERLETLSVPVLGYQTHNFPGFFTTDSGFRLTHKVDSPKEIAEIVKARDEMGLNQAILIANPPPSDLAFTPERYRELVESVQLPDSANWDIDYERSRGILEFMASNGGGDSWQLDVEIYRRNAELAGEIAKYVTNRLEYTD